MHPDREDRDLEVEALLSHLDHPTPQVTVDEVIARAEAGPRRWRAWAAGIVLAVVAAGAAYAAPGSPVPGWIRSLTNPSPSPETPPPDFGGVSFGPGEPLIVSVNESPEAVHVHIVLTEESSVVVRSTLSATRFRVEPGRVEVDVTTPDTLEVLIPRASVGVEVESGAHSLFSWDGSTPRSGVEPEADGSYLLRIEPGGL